MKFATGVGICFNLVAILYLTQPTASLESLNRVGGENEREKRKQRESVCVRVRVRACVRVCVSLQVWADNLLLSTQLAESTSTEGTDLNI